MQFLYLLAFWVLLPLGASASLFGDDCPTAPITAGNVTFTTAFTGTDKFSQTLLNAVRNAKTSIKVITHNFYSKDLSLALHEMARQGKQVEIILDRKTNENGYSELGFLQLMSHNPHYVKDKEAQLQDYIIIDDNILILGTIAAIHDADDEAKSSAGIVIIGNAPELAKKYVANFQSLWDNSEGFKELKEQKNKK